MKNKDKNIKSKNHRTLYLIICAVCAAFIGLISAFSCMGNKNTRMTAAAAENAVTNGERVLRIDFDCTPFMWSDNLRRVVSLPSFSFFFTENETKFICGSYSQVISGENQTNINVVGSYIDYTDNLPTNDLISSETLSGYCFKPQGLFNFAEVYPLLYSNDPPLGYTLQDCSYINVISNDICYLRFRVNLLGLNGVVYPADYTIYFPRANLPAGYNVEYSSVNGSALLFNYYIYDNISSDYNQGYNDGYKSGYTSGESIGYSNGYTKGYDNGKNTGYDNGYNSGYEVGKNDGIDYGYNNGYEVGKNDGLSLGEVSGYTKGKADGETDGYNKGYNVGVNEKLKDITPWQYIVDGVNAFLNLQILPNVKISVILSVGFGVLLLGFAIKIFLGG